MENEKPPATPLVLKKVDWPERDRTLWDKALGDGNPFADPGDFAGHSDGTLRLRIQGYGQWLSFVLRKHPEKLDLEPWERVTRDIVGEFIAESKLRLKYRSIANLLLSLLLVTRAFAPGVDLKWLNLATRRTYLRSNPGKLKPPLPIAASEIYNWALERLEAIEADPDPDPLETAMWHRQALMVGCLISAPVRRRAFCAMTVDHHVLVHGASTTLRFGSEDMKDKKARQIPLPAALSKHFIRYLEQYRSILAQGSKSRALWFSQRGNPLSDDSFASGLAKLTLREFGIPLRPHAFRHIAATSIAVDDPTRAGIIRDVLGHASMRMADAHYNRATGLDVSNKLQSTIAQRRRRGRKARNERR